MRNLPTLPKLLPILLALVQIAQAAESVSLRVEAVNPITGAVLSDARVRVQALDGKRLCIGLGVLSCALPPGDYRLSASKREFGGRAYPVHLSAEHEFRRISIWFVAPITYDRRDSLAGKKNPRSGRIDGMSQAEAATGYWLKASAVFDSALQAEAYATTPEFRFSDLPIGLYQLVVSPKTGANRIFQLEVHDGCRLITIPSKEDGGSLLCN